MNQATATFSRSENSVKPKQIGQLLQQKGIISQSQIDQALDHQKSDTDRKLLGEVLIELGFVTEDQVAEVLAEAYGMPYVKLSPGVTDPSTVEVLPREFIEKHLVLPMFQVNGKLTVAVHEPANVFLIEEVERVAGCPVQIAAATQKDITQMIQALLPNSSVFVIDEIVDGVEPADLSIVDSHVTDLTNLEDAAGQSPVVKMVNFLLFSAVNDNASDIHIEPDEHRLRVRYRLDGRLFEKVCPPVQMAAAIASRIKIMASLDISERRIPQDGGMHVMIDGRPIDLRVSTMPGKYGEKVVIRVIDNSNVNINLDKLGFGHEMLERFKTALHQPNGIILVTGPTGSGKSTTLYSALSEVNDEDVNICTVEDPIEFSLGGVNQFQVNEKAGFTFASALRSLLRQDPDIIMLGEIRDVETAKIAVQAALTGHQVLTTLHTNDAPSAVTRLTNVGVESFLIAASLRAVLAQRLVRKICPDCKEMVEPTKAQAAAVSASIGETIPIYEGRGCKRCRDTGYRGRIGIYELFTPSEEIVDLIAKHATLVELKSAARDAGYLSLRKDGMEKVRAGITTVEEVLRATAG